MLTGTITMVNMPTANVSQIVAQASKRRVRLEFRPGGAGTFFLADHAMSSSAQGDFVGSGFFPVVLTYEMHGEMVRRQWQGLTGTAGSNLAVIEVEDA